MIRGDGQKIFMVKDTKISTVISFEGSFQRYIRNSVQDGAELVVILTNQASYGESGMSDQFILMSRANAISNSRPIVHAAITGKSAFIDHKGKVISKRAAQIQTFQSGFSAGLWSFKDYCCLIYFF